MYYKPLRQSHFFRDLLLLRLLLLTNILEPKPKSEEERHGGESRKEVEHAVNALSIRDQNASEFARIEDLAELGGSGGNYGPGVGGGVLTGNLFPQRLGEDGGAEAEEQCSAEHAAEHDHGQSNGCLGWWEVILDGDDWHLKADSGDSVSKTCKRLFGRVSRLPSSDTEQDLKANPFASGGMSAESRAEAVANRCENDTAEDKGCVSSYYANETTGKHSGEKLGEDAGKHVHAAHCRRHAVDGLEVDGQVVVCNCEMRGLAHKFLC